MSKTLENILSEIEATEDNQKREQLIQEAFEMDHHDPRVLKLAASTTEDAYDRLRLIDHALRHSRHDLMHQDAFSQENLASLPESEDGLNYLEMLDMRLQTFLELSYDYQALADANELLYLDQKDTFQTRYSAMIACLRTNNFPLAEAIYHQFENINDFSLTFPYAALLFEEGRKDEATALVDDLLTSVPNFRTILVHVINNEELDEEILNDSYEILYVLNRIGNYLPNELLDSVNLEVRN